MALLVFDLDGTLIDSREDLVQAMNATRVHMQREPLDGLLIQSYVGNGAMVLIQRAFGPETPPADIQAAHDFFISYYRQHPLDFTTLYPGIEAAVDELFHAGHKLAILTNKPLGITRRILTGLGMAERFFQVYGGDSFPDKKPDPSGLLALIAEAEVTPQDTWMIGDSAVDMETARNAGVRSCGVTWGFQPETLHKFPPDLLVDHISSFVTAVS